jgi:hypothetical protein
MFHSTGWSWNEMVATVRPSCAIAVGAPPSKVASDLGRAGSETSQTVSRPLMSNPVALTMTRWSAENAMAATPPLESGFQ